LKSIKVKLLVWFGLALLILLSLLGIITYLQVRDTVIPLTEDLSKEILVARSSEMSRLVNGYSAEVRTISRLDIIRRGDFEEIKEYLTTNADQINSDYEMIFFADREGNYITTNNLLGNIADREYFQAIIYGKENYFISDPMISRSTYEEIFVVAWAVFDENDEKIGVLASTVLLETLSGIAAEIKIGENGFGYIVDKNGLLFAHPNEELRMSLNFLDSAPHGYEGLVEVGLAMIEGQTGVLTYTRPNGERLVTAFNPIPATPGWSLGVSLYQEELLGTATALMSHLIITIIAVILAVLIMVYFISDRISKPILQLTDGVKMVSSGDLNYTLTVKTGDEIEELAGAFNRMTADLKEYISNLQKTTAEKERIESELQVANKIQSSMLPRTFPPYPDIKNLDLYATMEAAREVGGDFYDFFPLDNRRFCFSIGDVSGKGIPAALFMVITRTILKNQTLQGNPLAEIFNQTNNLLCSDNVEDMFVTVFMGILDPESGEVEYVCAGHNPPLISRQGGDCQFLDVKRNLVLGGMEDFSYQAQKITLEPGDLLFLYTDGLNEAMNEKGDLFGDKRMFTSINDIKGDNVRRVIDRLKEAVGNFVQDTPASDDLTMLALKITSQDE
jgi:phosphoserine phosphatase RsbU/P